jgi:hypothetical protein
MRCHVVQLAGTDNLEELAVSTTKDMGNRFFKITGTCQPKYKASYPGRQYLTLTATRTTNLKHFTRIHKRPDQNASGLGSFLYYITSN